MAGIPTPRTPRCLKHHRWMAGCPDCAAAHTPAVKAGS